MKKAVIIIPTYNEAKTIEKTLLAVDPELKKIPDGWKVEVLIVDDSSPDGTAQVVKRVSQKLKYVHLFSNPHKAGLGGAYLKGMDQAFHHMDGDVVFEFDADLSHDPKKIPEFLSKIDEGYDLVLGSRYIPGGSIPDDWGLNRKFLSVLGNIIIMLVLTDFRIRDWTTGYRAIKKQVYEAVKEEMATDRFSGYTFQIGFLHKAVRKGFKVAEVPIHFIDRTEGESKLGAEYIKNTLMYILKARYKEVINHRIFKFVIVGGISATSQLISLQIFRKFSSYLLAFIFAMVIAITVNFILSNLWTFADRKLKITEIPLKYVIFFISSLGSALIQFLIALGGSRYIGIFTLFNVPVINYKVDTGLLFGVIGILIGMFSNFFAYSRIVWRKKE